MTLRRWIILLIWLILIMLLLYFYFYQPAILHQLFKYPGPGSPYVNTPQG